MLTQGIAGSLREECRGTGVKIATLCPGSVASPWWLQPERVSPLIYLIHFYTYTSLAIYIQIDRYVHAYIYMHVYICMYTFIHVYMYMYRYIHK